MQTLKKYLTLVLLLLLASMGTALTLKAAVGVGPFDALNQTLAFVLDGRLGDFSVRVGDVVTVVQLLMVIAQFLILRRNAHWRLLLQVPLSALFGQFINLFFYEVYIFEVENYIIRVVMLIVGTVWVAFFIGAIMVLDLVTMPVESFAMVLSQSINKDFGRVRQVMDIIFIFISLALTLWFSVPFTIREGTIVSALIFGPCLSLFMPKIEQVFKKWNLVEETLTVE